MNKKGKETVLTAYIILITVALVGGFLTYHISTPTGFTPIETETAIITINSFDAVFDPDGTTSMKFTIAAKEKVQPALNGQFRLSIETAGQITEFVGSVFFDGAFGELQSLKMLHVDGDVSIKDAKGTILITNLIDNTATMLVKLDFKRPDQEIFSPPSKLLIDFEFESYNKKFQSKILPVRHADKPSAFPYYKEAFDILEISV